MSNSLVVKILKWLFWLSLLTPWVYWQQLQYPFVMTKISLFQILVELGLPFYLYLAIQPEYRPRRNVLNISMGLFLALSLVAGVLGVNFDRSFWGIPARMSGVFDLAHLVLAYYYFLLLSDVDAKFASRTIKILVSVASIAAAYGLWTASGLPKIFAELYPPRISSVLGNPAFFASYLVIPLFLTVLLTVQEEEWKKRIGYFLLTMLQLAAIYLSGTRGAFLGVGAGLLVGVALILIFYPRRKIKYFGLAVLILIIVTSGAYVARYVRFQDNDSQARLIQWRVALQGFKEHPIFGVGPENYYAVANKYFDPKIYNYDASWWDKPHNSLLEILVTTGIVGFVAFAVMNLAAMGLIWKFFKRDPKNLAPSAVLAAALVAFQAQNFFVFETIPASLQFFMLLGLIGYFANPAEIREALTQKRIPNHVVLTASSLVAIVAIYYGNVLPVETSYAVNQGVKFANFTTSKKYFQRALTTALGSARKGDVLVYYSQHVANEVAASNSDQDSLKEVNEAIGAWESETAVVKNNPNYWLQLGNLDYASASLSHSSEAIEQSKAAIAKAIELVPKRTEPLMVQARVQIMENDLSGAEATLDKMQMLIPDNPNSNWHSQNRDNALEVYDLVIAGFAQSSNYPKVVKMYFQAIRISPADYRLYSGLAAAYAEAGDKVKAREAAAKVLELNPAAKNDVDSFINSLK